MVLVLIGIFFALFVKNFKLDASSDALLLESDRDLRIFRETIDRYSTQDFLFITFTPEGDLFSDESLSVIGSLRKDLRALEKTASVTTLLDVPLLKIVGGKLSEVADNYKTLDDPEVDREKARQEIMTRPMFRNLIISEDGSTTALIVYLKNDQEYLDLQKQRNRLLIEKMSDGLDADERQQLEQVQEAYARAKEEVDRRNHENINAIRAVIDKYRSHGELHLGGISMITDDMIRFISNDLVVFGLGVFLFLILMLSYIFRKPRWVILPLLSCIYAGLIMIGLLGLVGWQVTVISSNFISLMLILTMSMNVHLVVRYRQLSQEMTGADQSELVFTTTRKMVWPCLYTALTTMIGFSSLVFSNIKPVIDFGWMMTLGLGVTFLTSFLLFPSLLLLLPRTDPDSRVSDKVPFTAALASITQHHGSKILVLSLVLAIASGYGITRLRVENSFINYFRDNTEIYQGLKLIDEKLGGTTPLEILLNFDHEHAVNANGDGDDEFEDLDALFGGLETDPESAWFTTDKIELIKEVHDYVNDIPAVGKVLSLASVIRLAETLNQGQPFDAFELAVIYKRMPDELRRQLIDPYVSIEDNEARITLRIIDSMEDLRRKELLEQIHAGLQNDIGLEPDQFQLTGLLVLYNNMLQSLFRSQILTLGVVLIGIALMLLVLFRSVSLAVIGIIPNILAAAIILGLMGWLEIPLDMMTITIAAITIGIAVDNAIHYIYRFREEYPGQQDYIKTLHLCHANIGRAVFYTAITIIIGFSILVLSNFIPTIYFGLLTALAMFIALLAALTLLPKLILIWRPF
ncbi:MAG: MMPL family transporter [Gammaproteobacteria bacterium]|nr:MMPL family transporter [Gammaproteobacteria bacterium]